MAFFRDKLSVFKLTALSLFGRLPGIHLYRAVPLMANGYGDGTPGPSIPPVPVCPPVLFIYDFLPRTPIAVRAQERYSFLWNYPDDYTIDKTYPGGTDIAIGASDDGTIKIYVIEDDAIITDYGKSWSATVTHEGTLILSGPRCDKRGEVCIIVPYGWSLDGMKIGEELEVIEAVHFPNEAWEKDPAYLDRQVYTILYDVEGFPKLITQECDWDTDNLSPVVKTTFHDDQVHGYDLKQFVRRWHMQTDSVNEVYKFMPTPVQHGMRRSHLQLRIARQHLDKLIDKHIAETTKFDKYRNPDTLPDWSATW